MEIPHLLKKLPLVKVWMNDLISRYSSLARSVSSFGFKDLPQYFSGATLDKTKVISLESVPVPPLASFGLPNFSAFEHGNYSGITFDDYYFIRIDCAFVETVHCHELVHVIQWRHLGVDLFLMAYALGLLEYGYKESPLEVMAREHERSFDSRVYPYDVEQRTKEALDRLIPEVLRKIQSK